MRFELHCHSTCSDGTEAPERVAARAAERSVEVFALTDHDTCAGFTRGLRAPEVGTDDDRGQPLRLRAVEISCDEPTTGRTIHVLAYDRGHPAWSDLEAKLVELREARRNRMRVMAARLVQRGIRIDVEPMIAEAEASGRALGRPDLARAMVARGAASSLKDAFSRFLYDGGPVDVPHHALALPDALALGRACGAAMALAHPHLYDQLGVALLRQHVRDALGGVEAFYGAYDVHERTRWIALADELGLVCTAGSDSHGPDDRLGVDVPDERGKRLYDWLFSSSSR